MATSQYAYQSLPEGKWFRVLKLHPYSTGDSVLSCELLTVELGVEETPSYKALSYVWGDPSAQVSIMCSGSSLSITHSLFSALKRVRHVDRDVVVWADAICINQQDVVEKGTQVNMMGDIYDSADEVIVWLGDEHAEKSHKAFATIQGVCEMITTGKDRESFQAPGWQIATRSVIPSVLTEETNQFVETLFKLPWFSRVWVLQEVGLATRATAHWGSASLEFTYIAEFTRMAMQHSDLKHYLGEHMVQLLSGRPDHALWNVWSTYNKKGSWLFRSKLLKNFAETVATECNPDFVLVLEGSRLFDATNPLDHVYAFLGHPEAKVPGTAELLLQADYTITIDELNKKVATRLALTQSLNFLVQVQPTADTLKPNSGIPSWIPRWHINVPDGPRAFWETWDASLRVSDKRSFEANVQDDRLAVTGIILDLVAERTSVMTPDNFKDGPVQAGKLIEGIWNLVTQQGRPSRYGKNTLAAVASTLVCNYHSRLAPPEDPDEAIVDQIAWFCMRGVPDFFQQKLSGLHPKGELFSPQWDNNLALLFGTKMEYAATHRRFFITRGGLFGLGPALMEDGDLCVVLLGADVPFVIRPTDTKGHYILIGECYLYGVMYGQAMKEWESGESGYTKKEIVLV
ncbi:hypothetical protein jhhlp_007911 [Lomentospora prolificans]|uniref:Heterokaryon incompatibility domain-containing protein n=1 Tax=Lomentospora prolificans TaxID=41688 RepID=A0A2N3N0X8_9PEZI|nr:hypothetical protein jhhlp_007911 [Lomentospora prolificans]